MGVLLICDNSFAPPQKGVCEGVLAEIVGHAANVPLVRGQTVKLNLSDGSNQDVIYLGRIMGDVPLVTTVAVQGPWNSVVDPNQSSIPDRLAFYDQKNGRIIEIPADAFNRAMPSEMSGSVMVRPDIQLEGDCASHACFNLIRQILAMNDRPMNDPQGAYHLFRHLQAVISRRVRSKANMIGQSPGQFQTDVMQKGLAQEGVVTRRTSEPKEILKHLEQGKPVLLSALGETKDSGLALYDSGAGTQTQVGGTFVPFARPWYVVRIGQSLIGPPFYIAGLRKQIINGAHSVVAVGIIEASPGDKRILVLNSWNRTVTLLKASHISDRTLYLEALLTEDDSDKPLRD